MDKQLVLLGLPSITRFRFDHGPVPAIQSPYNAICPTLSPLFSVARRPTFAFPRLSLRFRQRSEQVRVFFRFATRWSFLIGPPHSTQADSANSSAVSGSLTRSRPRFGCRLLHVLMSIGSPSASFGMFGKLSRASWAGLPAYGSWRSVGPL